MPVVPRFKPPLTIEQLSEIQSRRRTDPDVMALLWEIHRLHSTVSRADQLMRTIDESGGVAHRMVADLMREDLKEEPCLLSSRQMRKEFGFDKLKNPTHPHQRKE